MRKTNLKTVDSDETSVEDFENFEAIDKLTAKHIREPSLIPDGPWTLRNLGYTARNDEDRDGNPIRVYNFRYEAFEPGPEVDPEAIERGGYESRALFIKRRLSLPPSKAMLDGSLARLVKFIELHGVEVEEDVEIPELCASVKGHMIGGVLGNRSWDDKEGETHHDNTVDGKTLHSVEG